VRDVNFIRILVDESLRGQSQVLHVVAAFALTGLTDLHQKAAILSEFQDHVVVEAAPSDLSFVVTSAALRTAAIAANPHVTFVIDGDAMIGVGPIVTLSGTAPMAEQVAGRIE